MTPGKRGLRSEAIREANLLTILRSLHLGGRASRSTIGTATGLTRSTIGALVTELGAANFVQETRADSEGRRGRPSPLVGPRSESNVVISIEVLVDSVAIAAVGLGGPILRSVRRDRRRDQTELAGTVSDIATLTTNVIDSLEAGARVWSIGIAVPGLVRRSDHQVILAPNLQWTDVAIRDLLAAELALNVPIFVGNEADLAALAESRRGAVAGIDDVVFLSGEVGVGGGFISGGQIVEGHSGFAGEIGHIPVNIDGQQCNCGSFGCFETEAGEEALLERAGLPRDGGRAALAQLFASAEDGDEKALAAFAEHGRWVGFGVAGLVNTLNPQAVVFGGFLGPSLTHMRAAVDEQLDRRVLADVRANLTILASELGPDAPLFGAAEMAWNHALPEMVREVMDVDKP